LRKKNKSRKLKIEKAAAWLAAFFIVKQERPPVAAFREIDISKIES